MFNLIPKSLVTKLIAVTGGTIALVMLASNVMLVSAIQNRISGLIATEASSKVHAIAAEIAGSISELTGTVQSTAGIIGLAHDGGHLDRRGVVEILKANAHSNPLAVTSWFAEASNGFDGLALAHKGPLGTPENGAVIPVWGKNESGLELSFHAADYEAEWYTLSARSDAGAITHPYIDTFHGWKIAMASLTFPGHSGGKFKAGDVLFSMEAMKIETALHAEMDGMIAEVFVKAGDQIDAKDIPIVYVGEVASNS
jgi:methyl-accepting chemotaxis protein